MGAIEDLKRHIAAKNKLVLVQNVPSCDLDDRSFIEYWEERVNSPFSMYPYECPATGVLCKRNDLDGAHVRIIGDSTATLYITAVHKSFNRSRSAEPFKVKRRFLVVAPKQQ